MPTDRENLREQNQRMFEAYQKGDYGAALTCAEASVQPAKSVYGDKSIEYATILNNLAMLLRRLGRYEEAEVHSRLALDTAEAAAGPMHPQYASNLNNLGLLLIDLAKFDEAETVLLRAVALRKQISGEESDGYATSLNNLAILRREMGRYDESLTGLVAAAEIRKRLFGELSIEYAESITSIGAMYQTLGRYPEAENTLRHAVGVYAQLIGESHPDFIDALSNLAAVLRETGNHSEASRLLQRVLQHRREILGREHPLYALSLSNLAGHYREIGRIEQAIHLYEEALAITVRSFGEQHPKSAAVLDNLALAHCEMGDFHVAEGLYQLVIDHLEATLGAEHPDYALCISNLAHVYAYMHRYEDAISLLKKVQQIQAERLAPTHPERAITENNLAAALLATGEFVEAERLFRRRLRASRLTFGTEHGDYTTALNNLAFVSGAQGRHHQALSYWKRVISYENRLLPSVFAISSDKERLQFKRKLQTTYHAVLSLVIENLSADERAVQFAARLVLQRKGLTGEASLKMRQAVLASRRPNLMNALSRLLELKQQIPRAALSVQMTVLTDEERQRWRENLEAWEREHDDIETSLATEIPEVGLAASLKKATWRSVVKELSPGTCLIEFVRYFPNDLYATAQRERRSRWVQPRYAAFVFVCAPKPAVTIVRLGAANDVERLVNDVLQQITNPKTVEGAYRGRDSDESNLADAAERLAAMIWHPVQNLIADDKRLIVCPDGILNLFPFELLHHSAAKSNESHIIYLNTGRELVNQKSYRSPSKSSPPYIAAAPNYNLSLQFSDRLDAGAESNNDGQRNGVRSKYAPIVGALVEGSILARWLQAPVVTSDDATEGHIKADCRNPVVLHLSTHGDFDEVHEEATDDNSRIVRADDMKSAEALRRSWLAMAGVNAVNSGEAVPEGVEDGILTAEDVTGLDLSGTRLVVLSACRSGLGRVVTGEGVFGLRRAFQQAGAQMLLVSLWSVEGLSTAWLMDHFYRALFPDGNWLHGPQIAMYQALDRAQHATREATARKLIEWFDSLHLPPQRDRSPSARLKQWRYHLQKMRPEHRPFMHPYYWAGFILIGPPMPPAKHHK